MLGEKRLRTSDTFDSFSIIGLISCFLQIGDSTSDRRNTPVTVLDLENVVSLWAPQSRRLISASPSLQPSTAQMMMSVIGAGFAVLDLSARIRTGETASVSSQWRSDTLVACRTAHGVGFGWTVRASIQGNFTNLITGIPGAFSYARAAPSPVATPQRHSINITGSNLLPIPVVSACSIQQLRQEANTTVCELNMLAPRNAGLRILNAAFSFSFSQVSRLDDITIFLQVHTSSGNSTFTLMRNKCSCFSHLVAGFDFHVSFPDLPIVPASLCAANGRYSPDDAAQISDALLKPGKWILMIRTGGITLNLLSASITFLTESLQFRIGTSFGSEMRWFSESSVVFQVPGYQIDSPSARESAGGYGRNLPITAQVNSSTMRFSVNLS